MAGVEAAQTAQSLRGDCMQTREDEGEVEDNCTTVSPGVSWRPNPSEHNSDSSDESISDSESIGPETLLMQGKPVVPNFIHRVPECYSEAFRAGTSLQHFPLEVNHQELIWLGSSLGTMHKVPMFCGRGRMLNMPIGGIVRNPSIVSKVQLSSRFGSQTVSECGTDNFSFCRICQMTGDEHNPLFSPCRCAGSLKYIHATCLKKWIRYSQRRGKKHPPRCELCHYQFLRHKHFKFGQWRWPRVRPRDKFLHAIFLLNLLIMVGCAIATVMCFLSDRGKAVKNPKDKVSLTYEEVITLTCGVTFFVAFFIAMTVEIKARHTLYRLVRRFITHNTEWTVEQYDPSKDRLLQKRLPTSQV